MLLGLSGNQSKAQLLNFTPEQLHNYVMLDYQKFQEFETWDVDIKQRFYIDSINYVDSTVFSQKVIGQDYYKVPDVFFNDSLYFLLILTGYDKQGSVIEVAEINIGAQVPDGTEYHHNYHKWICNGWQYAYEIDSHMALDNGNNTGAGYLSLDFASYATDPKMYVYYHTDVWNNLLENNPQMLYERHGNFGNPNLGYSSNPNFNFVENADASADLRGWDGLMRTTATSSALIGVRKEYGMKWRNHLGSVITNINAIYNEAWDILDVVEEINLHANPSFDFYNPPMEELECIGYGVYDPIVNDPPDAISFTPYTSYRYYPQNDTMWPLESNEDEFEDIYDLIDRVGEAKNSVNDDKFTWPNDIVRIDLTKLSNGGENICRLYADSITDVNGNIITPSFSMTKGLYSISFVHPDASHNYSIIEVNNKVTNNLDVADFFEITIYPVPLFNDYFFINLQSELSDEIEYTLFDDNGRFLHNEQIIFTPQASRNLGYTFKIKPDRTPLLLGVLINKFVFSDGSSQSIQILKQ
ncbi:MAG: hypothetical protein U9N51_11265 [Bacteroidota bacterium]|nr:hypothetical protein [Bacteroidota bacterium]